MKKILLFLLPVFVASVSFCQKIETVYLNAKDSSNNMYMAVVPESGQIDSFMFLLDGFGNSPSSGVTCVVKLAVVSKLKSPGSITPGASYYRPFERLSREDWIAINRA